MEAVNACCDHKDNIKKYLSGCFDENIIDMVMELYDVTTEYNHLTKNNR
jgi:hypothetical protein